MRDAALSDIAALTARIERLEHELTIQQDIHHVRRLQYTYGYFIDKSQYNEVVELFADDGEVWFLGGIYRGKAGVRRLYIERFQRQFTARATGGSSIIRRCSWSSTSRTTAARPGRAAAR